MRNTLKTLAFIALSCLIGNQLYAQTPQSENSWNYSFMRRYATMHPHYNPSSHALSYKGQLRLDAGLVLGNRVYTGSTNDAEWIKTLPDTISDFFKSENSSASDIHIALNYTPWEHITINTTLSMGAFIPNNSNLLASSNYVWAIGGKYHNKFSDNFAYEGGYSIGIGGLDLSVKISRGILERLVSDNDSRYKLRTDCSYTLVNQNLTGGFSAFTGAKNQHRFQATFLLNLGHTHYSNFRNSKDYNQWDNAVKELVTENPNMVSLTPTIIFTLNVPWVLSAHISISRPTTWIDGNSYTHTNCGLHLSFRLRKIRTIPQETV